METVKSRSESPFSVSKTKNRMSDSPENGVIEQMKTKKRSLRNKSKSQSNDKENERITNPERDISEEKEKPNETENHVEMNNSDHEISLSNGNEPEITNGDKENPEMESKINDAMVSACEAAEETIECESKSQIIENIEESVVIECVTTEEIKEVCIEDTTETEISTKEDNLVSNGSSAEGEFENPEEKLNGNTEDVLKIEENIPEEEKTTEENSNAKDCSQISINGSEGSSHYEDTNTTEDFIQASPDTATKEEESLSSKITNFLGKWSYSQEQKEDSEVSSSKKSEPTLNHPYLIKVSGRRGIKERLNSSATVFTSKGIEVKTPEHSGISLDDSFRVRTNPPRLNFENLTENPTLRKFKGKRCLNTGEPDDEDDIHSNVIKRRKLDDKTQESGILGSILWSPFKKKSLDPEEQIKLATTESKLSRLLSPFWFWKKTAAGQKGK